MRRALLIGLLTLGVIGGYGSAAWRFSHDGWSCDRGCPRTGEQRGEQRAEQPDGQPAHR
ncbi:MAG: hypothetical protein HYS27_00555 [Deltaproteobacteria bacterium]|nr:hypothetical protein [Deltaproteobacteria bacterium]